MKLASRLLSVSLLICAFTALAPNTVLWTEAQAQSATELEVDLELVLAVDISLSMDIAEQELQRDGYVAAFRHPDVINAISSGALRRIAVTYVEWAGAGAQAIKVPWTLIDGGPAALAFADQLAKASSARWRRTSISGAIAFGSGLFQANGYSGLRQVIDISGDGPNNMGPPVTIARDKALAEGIIINGLPIMLNPSAMSGFFDIARLDEYYEDCVIGGTGAFIVTVTQADEFATAIRRKLLLEIADRQPAARPRLIRTQFQLSPQRTPRLDCEIGEQLWQEWMRRQDWE